jgi:hypothetical protein
LISERLFGTGEVLTHEVILGGTSDFHSCRK